MRSPKSPQKLPLRNGDQDLKEQWTLPIGRSKKLLNNNHDLMEKIQESSQLTSPSSPSRPSRPSQSSDRSSQTSHSTHKRSSNAINALSSGSNPPVASTSQFPTQKSSSSVRSSRRFDQARPSTASTVGSYMSARPFMEDPSSPTRRAIPIPLLESQSSSKQSSEFIYEDFLANNGDTLLISPIGELNRQNSVTKRDILNSANSAYASSSGSHHDDDSRSATSSRRTVHAIADDLEEDGDVEEHDKPKRRGSSRSQNNLRSPSRSRSKASNRAPSLILDGKGVERNASISTHGSAKFSTPPNGSASPSSPTTPLPIHPHHRVQKTKENEREALPHVSSQHAPSRSDSSNLTEKQDHHTPIIQPVPKNNKKDSSVQVPMTTDHKTKGTYSRNDRTEELEKTPASQTTPKFADLSTFESSKDRKSPLVGSSPVPGSPALSEKSGNAFRERMKKTGGFFRRLGGGGGANNLGINNNIEASSSKISLLQPRKQVLRKGSHSSLISESAQNGSISNSRNMYKEAASTDDVTSWSRLTDVPVPSIPQQYRQPLSASASKSSENTIRGRDQNDAQISMAKTVSNQRLAGQHPNPKSSGDFSSALKAWEKEMDAALEKSGQNLEEKTKIEAPRANWTPSPQLPEYKVLNRKGSFMDEGNEESGDKKKPLTIDGDASKAFGISMSQKDGRKSPTKESLSYDSHFLRPGPFRPHPRNSNPDVPSQTVSSPILPSSNISPSTEPLRSVSKFSQEQDNIPNEKPETFNHSKREDNVSTMTTKSYETAVERPSLFLKHAEQEANGANIDQKSYSPNSSNLTATGDIPSEPVSPSVVANTEPSIRLVTATDQKDDVNPVGEISSKVIEPEEHRVGSNNEDVEKAKDLAEKCWNEDESFKKREKIAEWLGGYGIMNKRARVFYFTYLDFAGQSVDAALRKLCDKLVLRAETQQVDRILAAFSQRYVECNPKTAFGNADIVHAVTFSIFLLNTDLHVADVSERMTRQQFIRNTIDAILESRQVDEQQKSEDVSTIDNIGSKGWEARMELSLRDIYNAVKTDRIRLPLPVKDGLSTQRTARMGGSERVNALKRGSIRGIQGLIGVSNSNSRTSDEFGQFNNNTQSSKFTMMSDAQSRPSISSLAPPSPFLNSHSPSNTPTMGFASTLSKSIIRENNEENETSSIDSEKDDFTDEELALMGPPWAKEGMLTRKHYWEAPSKRAKDKNWLDCFTVVQKGQLSMFRFGASTNSDTVKRSVPAVGGGNWLSNATCIGQFSLAHSLANILPPPGYNRSRPHVFALSLPSGSVYFFQAAHEELVQEWVATCNYWAARLSKEPMAAGVSNMEYGWNRLLPSASTSPSNEGYSSNRNDDLRTIGSARSIADTMSASLGENEMDESELAEEMTNSSVLESGPYSAGSAKSPSVVGMSNSKATGGDSRSIRSGRSGRSLRVRTNAIFQGWSHGNSLDQIVIASSSQNNANGNQSGYSSPLTSSTNLSSPGTSFTLPEKPMMVYDWRAPMPLTMPSNLSEEDQLEACIRQTARIEQDLTIHNSLRQPMVNIFRSSGSISPGGNGNRTLSAKAGQSTYSLSPSITNFSGPSSVSLGAPPTSPGGSISSMGTKGDKSMPHPSTSPVALANKALANWEKKSAYLLSELTKFQLYVESLKAANQLRSDKRSQRELNRMMRQADEGLRKVGNDVEQAGISANAKTS